MPWDISDVDKHKKGLSEKQKKQWVRIANSVLKRCMAKGGSEKECAASAIRQANGVVNANKDIYSVYKTTQSLDYDVKLTTHQGKAHLILPVVMMVEGVHNGSQGPLLHEIAELGKFPASWNGIPVVIYHPEEDGVPISANSPDIIDTMAVGRVYNTKIEDNKLKAEVWLDEDKLNDISNITLEMINNSKAMEVSLGMFTENEEQKGIYINERKEEEQYIGIAKNHRPDHLAILPDQIGACSCEDGCGLGVNNFVFVAGDLKEGINMDTNEQVTGMEKKRKELGMSVAEFYAVPRDPPSESKLPIFDEAHVRNAMARFNQTQGLSAEEKAAARRKIIAKAHKYGIDTSGFEKTDNIEVDFFINGQKYRQIYKIESGIVNFIDQPVKVRDDEVDNSSINNQKGDKSMSNKNECPKCLEKVNALIINKDSKFAETDREWLLAQTEEILDKLAPVIVEKTVEKTVEVNKLSPEDQQDLAWAKAMRKERRDKWIKGIQDNAGKEKWTDERLAKFDDTMLQDLYDAVNKEQNNDQNYMMNATYFGRKDVIVEPLLPSWVEEKNDKK